MVRFCGQGAIRIFGIDPTERRACCAIAPRKRRCQGKAETPRRTGSSAFSDDDSRDVRQIRISNSHDGPNTVIASQRVAQMRAR
jgi:hypothetical protein